MYDFSHARGGQWGGNGGRRSSQATINMMQVLKAQRPQRTPEQIKASLEITRRKVNGLPVPTELRIAAGELPTFAINYLED